MGHTVAKAGFARCCGVFLAVTAGTALLIALLLPDVVAQTSFCIWSAPKPAALPMDVSRPEDDPVLF